MANRYWLGSTTDWSSTSNWSTTDGGASGAAVPTSADDVFFTSTNVGNCTLTANSECLSLTIQDGYTGTFDAATFDMYVAGDVTFACTTGAVDLGTGDWLVDGSWDASACGTWTYAGSNVEFTGVAAATVYVHGTSHLGNVTISAGANVEIGSNGTPLVIYGDIDVYGTLTITTAQDLSTSSSSLTVRNGGSITGNGAFSWYNKTVIVEDGGDVSVATVHAHYTINIQGVFDMATEFIWTNVAVASAFALTFTGATTFNCPVAISWDQASTATIDLNTNAATVKLSDDIDLSTGMSAGTLVIDDAAGKFTLMGSGDQDIDFGGKTVNLSANKWSTTSTVTLAKSGDQLDLTQDSVFGHLVINGSYLNNGGNYDVTTENLTVTTGTFVSGTGTWTIGGNITIDASASTTTWAATSTIQIDGTTFLTVTGAYESFGDITINADGRLYITNSDSYIEIQNWTMEGYVYLYTPDADDGRIFCYETLEFVNYGRIQEQGVGYSGSLIMSGANAEIVNPTYTLAMKPSVLAFYNTNITLPEGYYSPVEYLQLYNGAGVDTTVTGATGVWIRFDTSILMTNDSAVATDELTLDMSNASDFRLYFDYSDSSLGGNIHCLGEWRLYSDPSVIDMGQTTTYPTFRIWHVSSGDTATFRNMTTLTFASGSNYVTGLTVESTVGTFDLATNSSYLTIRGGTADLDCPILSLGSYVRLYHGVVLDIEDVTTLNEGTCSIDAISGDSTITVGAMAIDPQFYKLVVYNGRSVTFTDTTKEVYFNEILIADNGTLTNNITSGDIKTHNLEIQDTGVIDGTGSLYLSRSDSSHPTQTYDGDPAQLQCGTVKLHCTGGYDMKVPSGTWENMTNLYFWCENGDFLFEDTYDIGASLLQLRQLSTNNVNFDFNTTYSSDIRFSAAQITLLDDSTGAMDFDSPLILAGTGDQDIADQRSIASVTNELLFSSAKTAGDIEVEEGTVKFTGTVDCGSFTVSGTGDVDFNDATVNCAGNMTLITTPDLGESTLNIGGNLDYSGVSGLTCGTSLVNMTGTSKSITSLAGSYYLYSLTIAEGATINVSTELRTNGGNLRVNGSLTTTANTYFYATDVYIPSTGRWTINGNTAYIYLPGAGKGIQQMDGVIDGTHELWLRGMVATSVIASGVYDTGLIVYAGGADSIATFDGEYTINGDLTIYGAATYTARLVVGSSAEIAVNGNVSHQNVASALSEIVFTAGGGVLLISGNHTCNVAVNLTVTKAASARFELFGDNAQTIEGLGEDFGEITLDKSAGDVTLDDVIATMSGSSEGGIIVQ